MGFWVLADTTIQPQQLGARANGVDDDTPYVQTAVDIGKDIYLGGASKEWVLIAGSTSLFSYGNTDVDVYHAVFVGPQGISLSSDGAKIKFTGYRSSDDSEINYAFLSAKTAEASVLRTFRVYGTTLEFNADRSLGRNLRSFHVVGCDDIRIEACDFTSTIEDRAGATITLQNCNNVVLEDLNFKDTTQGMNFSYVDNVTMRNLTFDNFVEAIDFDRVVSNAGLEGMSFKNGGECVDMSSVKNVSLDSISVEDVGTIVTLNYKPTTPPTYQEYIDNVQDPAVLTISENVSIRNVYGVNAGNASTKEEPAFSIGFCRLCNGDEDYKDAEPATGVTLSDIDISTEFGLRIFEVIDLDISRVNFRKL